ncbi:MAG: DUF58 domain-containing protein [Gemmatimonadales bacterium]
MPAAAAPETFIDPRVLAQVGDLVLLARTVVDGFLHGLHRSSRAGLSIDFAEHRPYQPGDDLRRIDWRVYGRTDRFYLKTYEADTNADVIFALDASASMDFGSTGYTKFDYARFLTASLAWLAQRQGDRVGLVTMSDDVLDVVPPSTRHLQLLLHTIGRVRPHGAGRIPAVLDRVANMTMRSGIAVLVSDCYEDPATLRRALGGIRARGQDVVVFHVIDAAERDLPWSAPANFEDAETSIRMPLRPDDLRSEYQEIFSRHRRDLLRELSGEGIDYFAVETDQPLDASLRTFLDRRLMGSRAR